MIPDAMAGNERVYKLEVPMNVMIGNRAIQCLAHCSLSTNLGGNEFAIEKIVAAVDLSQADRNLIEKLYERPVGKDATPVYDLLKKELENLCRAACTAKQLDGTRRDTAAEAFRATA